MEHELFISGCFVGLIIGFVIALVIYEEKHKDD